MENAAAQAAPVDDLNARIGVLTRREVEARILAPVIEALVERFGREEVVATVAAAIVDEARRQGRSLAEQMGSDSLHAFADSLRFWTQDGALVIDRLAQSDAHFDFNVTRCRYAELYRTLGIANLGALLSCNRDAALIDGFNPAVQLERTQTIMQGAAYCDFRYTLRPPAVQEPPQAAQGQSHAPHGQRRSVGVDSGATP